MTDTNNKEETFESYMKRFDCNDDYNYKFTNEDVKIIKQFNLNCEVSKYKLFLQERDKQLKELQAEINKRDNRIDDLVKQLE